MMVFTALLLVVAPAFAGIDDSPTAANLADKVDKLHEIVADPYSPDEQVYAKARDLFERIPDARIAVRAELRGWDMEPTPEKDPASIERLMSSAHERLRFYSSDVPEPDLRDAYSASAALHAQSKINYDSELDGSQMGSYKYDPAKREFGKVRVNDWIAKLAAFIGDPFAFTTLIHEAGHADKHVKGQLSPDAVILGEIASFYIEYLWVRLIDPHGERLAFLRTKAMNAYEREPTKFHEVAKAYLDHLAEVWETGGSFDKLKALVLKRGYAEKGQAPDKTPIPVRS